MGFFEDISSKGADVIHDLTKKSGGVPDSVRLKLRISEEEKNINSLYNQIGKTYFHLCAEDGDERFQSEILKIKESQAKIEECKNELNLLDGVRICPACGCKTPIGNNFCTGCGRRFDNTQAPEEGKMFCKVCGKSIEKTSVFCNYCGNRVD